MDWYYIDTKAAEEKRRRGPWSSQQMLSFATRKYVSDTTLVRHNGMDNWAPWGQVKIDAAEVEAAPAPKVELVSPLNVLKPKASAKADDAAAVPLAYAGFWVRGAALSLDLLILQLAWSVLAMVWGALGFAPLPAPPTSNAWPAMMAYFQAMMPFLAAFAGISFLYNTVFVKAFGATPGKLLLGLTVVRADGKSMSWSVAAWRCVAISFSQMMFGLGYLMAATDPEKRSLHDYLAGTRVVRKAI
jgi:uncharacterized RDD family membrane protein YckC